MKNMNLSNEIKLKFLKDYKLPLIILEDNYFYKMLELLNKDFDTLKKLEDLKIAIKILNNQENFLKENTKIINNIINDISSLEEYKKFSQDKLENFNLNYLNITNKDLYTLENINKNYIGFDIIKGNFTAIKYYNKNLVFNYETYENFITKYTNLDYFKNSKQIRQVIFGHLLQKKLGKIQSFMTNNLIKFLHEKKKIKEIDFLHKSNDEIVINFNNINLNELKNELLKNELLKNFRIETFKLVNIEDKKYFVKEHFNGKKEFKCIENDFFIQAYKKYYNIPIKKEDLQFYYKGQLATFNKSIFNESKKKRNKIN